MTPIGAQKAGLTEVADVGMFDHLLRDIRSVIYRDGEQNAIPPLDGALSPNDRLDALRADRRSAARPRRRRSRHATARSMSRPAGSVLKLSGTGFATRDAGHRVRRRRRRSGAASRRPAAGLRRRPRACGDRSDKTSTALARSGRRPALLAGLLSVAAAPDGRIFAVEGSTAERPTSGATI